MFNKLINCQNCKCRCLNTPHSLDTPCLSLISDTAYLLRRLRCEGTAWEGASRVQAQCCGGPINGSPSQNRILPHRTFTQFSVLFIIYNLHGTHGTLVKILFFFGGGGGGRVGGLRCNSVLFHPLNRHSYVCPGRP